MLVTSILFVKIPLDQEKYDFLAWMARIKSWFLAVQSLIQSSKVNPSKIGTLEVMKQSLVC